MLCINTALRTVAFGLDRSGDIERNRPGRAGSSGVPGEEAVDETAAAAKRLRDDPERAVAERRDIAVLGVVDVAAVAAIVGVERQLGVGEVAEHRAAAAADRCRTAPCEPSPSGQDRAVVDDVMSPPLPCAPALPPSVICGASSPLTNSKPPPAPIDCWTNVGL